MARDKATLVRNERAPAAALRFAEAGRTSPRMAAGGLAAIFTLAVQDVYPGRRGRGYRMLEALEGEGGSREELL
jgi:hypothetical protein